MRERIILLITVIWVLIVIASLRWRFLDPMVAGASTQPLAFDFFQAPCGFKNLLLGNSIFLNEASDYIGYGTPYLNHPLVAVAVGFWTEPFAPLTGYCLFVAFSFAAIGLGAYCLASSLAAPIDKAITYCVMFCSPVVYLLLHSGQMHVFLVLAVAMILAGLMRLTCDSGESSKGVGLIQAGVLISLLSKPSVLLMLPLLLLLPETRRKVFSVVGIYAAVSLLFLLEPHLNPGGYNARHWTNLFESAADPSKTYWLSLPYQLDMSNSGVVFSLPRILLDYCSKATIAAIVSVPLIVILALSLSTAAIASRERRVRAGVAVAMLCLLSHFLCYFQAFEYHYATVLPCIPAALWLRRNEESRRLRLLLAVALACLACVMLPTLKFLVRDRDGLGMACALMRVAPVAIAFPLLAFYAAACVREYLQSPIAAAVRQLGQTIQAAIRPGVGVALMLGTVFAVAYATIPARLLVPAERWSNAVWAEHCEDILSRPGVNAACRFMLERRLAWVYAQAMPDTAMQHFKAAYELTPRRDALAVELAQVFLMSHHRSHAEKLLSLVSPEKINEPGVRNGYWELRRSLRDSKAN